MSPYMPTVPRSGRTSISCVSAVVAVAGVTIRSLLVMPVGVLGMLQVPQRAAALHHRQDGEVVRRWRRVRRPFERPSIPRVATGTFAPHGRPQEIADEYQRARGLEERADPDEQVPAFPAATGLVRVDPARHAEE